MPVSRITRRGRSGYRTPDSPIANNRVPAKRALHFCQKRSFLGLPRACGGRRKSLGGPPEVQGGPPEGPGSLPNPIEGPRKTSGGRPSNADGLLKTSGSGLKSIGSLHISVRQRRHRSVNRDLLVTWLGWSGLGGWFEPRSRKKSGNVLTWPCVVLKVLVNCPKCGDNLSLVERRVSDMSSRSREGLFKEVWCDNLRSKPTRVLRR